VSLVEDADSARQLADGVLEVMSRLHVRSA
jgi:hypothetical protein